MLRVVGLILIEGAVVRGAWCVVTVLIPSNRRNAKVPTLKGLCESSYK